MSMARVCLTDSSKTMAEELFAALDASLQHLHGNLYRPRVRAHNRRTPRPIRIVAPIGIKKASHSGQIRA
jgi:hypothetical protein